MLSAHRRSSAKRDLRAAKQQQLERKDATLAVQGRQDREDHLRAGAPEALEVRRQDRGDERRAAAAVRGDAGRGRGQPAGAAGAAAGQAAATGQGRSDATPQAAAPGAARAPAPRGAPPRARGHHLPDPAAASRWCASARTSASGWTSCRRSSSCTGTSTASGPASAARCWCRSRWRRRSSTAACPPRGWWRTR